MLTQCPNCQTTFRVTTEILRVADGQVRCGRCQTQFDALERLIDEDESATNAGRQQRDRSAAGLPRESPRGAHSPAPASPIEVEEPAAQEDITLEGRHIEISGRYRMPDSPRGEPQIREETVEEWVEIDDIEEATQEPQEIDVEKEFADEDARLEDQLAQVVEADARRDSAVADERGIRASGRRAERYGPRRRARHRA